MEVMEVVQFVENSVAEGMSRIRMNGEQESWLN